MDKEKLAAVSAIALNSIFGNEPKFSHSIIDALGSCEAVFSLPSEELCRVFGPYSCHLAKINEGSLEAAELEYDRLKSAGYGFLGIYNSSYPALLRECPDAPIMLYVRSSTPPSELFNRGPVISIVGTRDMGMYGREWCTRIVKAISCAPVKASIASGLAMGVDITAHMAATACGLPTIGVSPVGIEDVYPRRHSTAAEKIVACPGSAVVTDYPPGTVPLAFNFLRRNRIIAGLADAVILIESKVKGGGMMTARLASDYGRSVFVLPGRVDDLRSGGCNALIAEKIAEPIISEAGISELLGLGISKGGRMESLTDAVRRRFSGGQDIGSTEMLCKVVSAIKKTRGIDFDSLCAELGLRWQELAGYADMLEREGFIEIDLLHRCAINFKNA